MCFFPVLRNRISVHDVKNWAGFFRLICLSFAIINEQAQINRTEAGAVIRNLNSAASVIKTMASSARAGMFCEF